MMTPEETVQAIRRFFAENDRGFAAVYVFGSVARALVEPAATPNDVDIAVIRGSVKQGLEHFETPTTLALEQLLQKKVDLVIVDDASPDLGHRIIRDGIVVSETDRSKRLAWETRTRALYFDLLPVLNRIRRTPAHLR